jgi:cupin fold WbuC family metalloprotein
MINISEQLISKTIEKSKNSERKRAMHCFHNPEDKIQRMLNAIQPKSYLPPHKHENKIEVFLALKGRFLVVEYNDEGKIIDFIIISPNGDQKGSEIPAKTWHNIIALEEDSVAYEIIEGPYITETHKVFPEWAPEEAEYEKGMEFIEKVKKHVLN